MANGVNKVILVGHLCADVDVRYIPSGQAVVNVRLATNESWKDRETGEREERAEFHNVVMFGRLAEVAAEYLRKGSQVFIEGKLRTRKWQDRDGNDRWTTEIIANHLLMLGSPNGNGSGAQRAAAARQSAQSPAEDYGAGGGFYDDIPFGPRLTD